MIDPDFIIDNDGSLWQHTGYGNYTRLVVSRIDEMPYATLRAEYGPLDCFVWRNRERGTGE